MTEKTANFDEETDKLLQSALHHLSASLLDCIPGDVKAFTCTTILGDNGAVHYRLEAEGYTAEQASEFIDEAVHNAACTLMDLIRSHYSQCNGFQIHLIADDEDNWKSSFDFTVGPPARAPRMANPLKDGNVQEIIDLIAQVLRKDIIPPDWHRAFLDIHVENGDHGPGLTYKLMNAEAVSDSLEVNEVVHKLTCVLIARWNELGHPFPDAVRLALNLLPNNRLEISFEILKSGH